MRKQGHLFLIVFFLMLSQLCSAQRKGSSRDTAFYNLDVPKIWQDNKVLFSLTGLIEKTVPFLKDKKVCVGCSNDTYTVSLFTTEPKPFQRNLIDVTKVYETANDKYEYNLAYYFFASLLVKTKDNSVLGEIVLVDSMETFTRAKVYNLPSTRSAIDYRALSKIQNGSGYRPTGTSGTNMSAYLFDKDKFAKDHEKEMLPDEEELRKMIQARMFAVKGN